MGIIFYELATLEYPYDIKNNDIEEFKKAHLYSSIKNSKLLKERTTLEIYSMIMGMLEKATQKRFKTWDDILQHVKKFFVQSASQLDAVVNKAVQEKTERDIKIQQEIELKKKREEYIANFCSLVKSQFENDILAILNNFVESYNNRLSSIDKSRLLDEHSYNQQFLVYKLIIPSITTIDIKCSIVLEKSIQREYFDWTGEVKTMWTTPVLKGRNVMCIISIENNNNYGFNLVLLASDGLYGDWFIVNNRNNLISRNDSEYRREPFAFNTNELDEIIISNEAMHIYSSKLLPFSEECFLKALSELLE